MDEFESLPRNGVGLQAGWTCILDIEKWLRELKRMIPGDDERNTWIQANCSRLRRGWSSRGPDTLMFNMRLSAFDELLRFQALRPSLRNGGYNRAPVIFPECMRPLENISVEVM